MMIPTQLVDLRTSYRELTAQGTDLSDAFFTRLFAAQPTLRPMFPRDADQRARDLSAALGIVVKNLHRLDSIEPLLTEMGVRNQRAGAQPHHYGIARDAMLAAMRTVAGPNWTDELNDAWSETFNVIASVIIRGAGRSRAKAA